MPSPIEILIIEDDKRIADIHRRFIEKIDGFSVIGAAHTGDEAKDWVICITPGSRTVGCLFTGSTWNRFNEIYSSKQPRDRYYFHNSSCRN